MTVPQVVWCWVGYEVTGAMSWRGYSLRESEREVWMRVEEEMLQMDDVDRHRFKKGCVSQATRASFLLLLFIHTEFPAAYTNTPYIIQYNAHHTSRHTHIRPARTPLTCLMMVSL